MSTLPTSAKERKSIPMASGVLDYFPNALVGVAECSLAGNEQHQPGEPLHWARGKSSDHADALMRHLIDREELDKDGIPHVVKVAWRALALAEEYYEKRGAKPGLGSKFPEESGDPADIKRPRYLVVGREATTANYGWVKEMDLMMGLTYPADEVCDSRVVLDTGDAVWAFDPTDLVSVKDA